MDLVTSWPRMVPDAGAAGAPTEPKEKDLASRPCRGSQLVAGMWELLMEGMKSIQAADHQAKPHLHYVGEEQLWHAKSEPRRRVLAGGR